MSFLTAGEDECRAWTIPMHSTAVKAAGAIHSDFEKKFIRAEVVNWKTMIDLGGYSGARDKGQLVSKARTTSSRTATSRDPAQLAATRFNRRCSTRRNLRLDRFAGISIRYLKEFASHRWRVWIRLMKRSSTAAPLSVR